MQFRTNLVKVFSTAALSLMMASTALPVFAQEAPAFPTLPADHPYAAFIDTYNTAIAKGATAEWRKLEGVAVDPVNNKLYFAVTAIEKTMSDTEGDLQLPENKCGAVYMADLDAEYNIASLTPVVVGGPYNEDDKDNRCNVDAIANPDNISVDAQGNLWIGEDTSYHKNNYLWMWNGSELKRFASVPAGAEVTGLRVEANGTVFMNVQHPSPMNIYPYNRGVIGVVAGYVAGDDFTAIEAPSGDTAHEVAVASGDYQVIVRVGEEIPGSLNERLGNIYDANGDVMNLCNNPDGNMFLPTNEAGTQGYLYTNFECQPGGIGRVFISQDEAGNWMAIEGEMVDLSAVNGTWNNCNASVTPWNSALSSEEYPGDNPGEWEAGWLPALEDMNAHLGKAANPYDYGYNIELVPSGGEEPLGTVATKRYAMGRLSKEMSLVMPDEKTVYMGDDGTGRILAKFVATNAGDLSEGTLYAAKLTQEGDTLNIEWIELGTAKDADIEAAIRELDAEFAAQ